MQTIILGKRSYISKNLSENIKNSKIYSLEEFINLYKKYYYKKKISLIINSFYPSSKLNIINNYEDFSRNSILNISKLLDILNKKKIHKIIYTSSSAVYGINIEEKEKIKNYSRSIYGSFKLSAEGLIKSFSVKNKIKFVVARVFNIYGKNDNNFSVISKIRNILLKKKKEKLIVLNKGNSVRDYINIYDLIKFYKYFLKSNIIGIYDVGSGEGTRLIDIIKKIKINTKNIVFSKKKVSEINYSVADIEYAKKYINFSNFNKIEDYFPNKFLIKKIYPLKYDPNKNFSKSIQTVIYGCGYSGKKITKQLISKASKVDYFIDDDPKKIGTQVQGIKVISFEYLKIISQYKKISNIIVAIPSLNGKQKLSLITKLAPICNSISTLPKKSYYKEKKIEVEDIQQISLEEIFNRNFFEIKNSSFNKFKNKKILVTGGGGSIGFEICKQLLKANPKKIIVLDHSEFNIYRFNQKLNNDKISLILGDVKDRSFIKNIIDKHKFDFIFHAAAYKHVKFLETNLLSAIDNNIFGTYSILKAIKNKKTNFIFISTDKAVKPKNILGMTKRIGEMLTQITSLNKEYKKNKFSIVRFGNVIGSDGSALPLFVDQIKRNLPISITDIKMKRYFMSIKEACSLVIQSSKLNSNGNIFVLDMGKQIKIIEIIRRLFDIYKKPDQSLKLKIIGNKYNEKISENLFLSRKYLKSKYKKIFIVKEPIPNNKIFFSLLDQLNQSLKDYDVNKAKLTLNFFFKSI